METVRLSDKLELTRVIVGCMRMMDAGKKGKDLLRFVHECMELGMNCFDHRCSKSRTGHPRKNKDCDKGRHRCARSIRQSSYLL